MLILQRKPGESLFIGNDIQITVTAVEAGGRVRLAIDAPRNMPILRSELRKAMDTNRDSAKEESTPLELLGFLGKMGESSSEGNRPR
ncbi:MAG: carbon storage regulator [Intestinimonas sp.]|jgi:carbon storage regulator|nr:carbon storage regulator [Intestinimonas sp.]